MSTLFDNLPREKSKIVTTLNLIDSLWSESERATIIAMETGLGEHTNAVNSLIIRVKAAAHLMQTDCKTVEPTRRLADQLVGLGNKVKKKGSMIKDDVLAKYKPDWKDGGKTQSGRSLWSVVQQRRNLIAAQNPTTTRRSAASATRR